jgi:Bacterial Ig-like domain (group 3)/Right handed beta helix region
VNFFKTAPTKVRGALDLCYTSGTDLDSKTPSLRLVRPRKSALLFDSLNLLRTAVSATLRKRRLPARRFALFLLLSIALCAAGAAAATIHVPADKPTIQAGIDAAADGDTVLVAPGTYYENIDFHGKAITVTSSGGAAQTIIDGSHGSKPAVFFISKETRSSILSGFTIQGGGEELYYGQMGGILMESSLPTLLNDIITKNHCYGVWAQNSSPLIQNSNLNNTLDNKGDCSFAGGAAIYLSGGASDDTGQPVPTVIIGNIIEDNTQSGQEDAGGNGGAGIAVWGGTPVIEDNIIRNNHSWGGIGAGIFLLGGGQPTLIVQNLIYGNQAGSGGGALGFEAFLGPVQAYIVNNTMVDNTSPHGEGGFSNDFHVSQIYSGAYGFDGPSVALVNNIIAGNTSDPAIQCGWGIFPTDESQQPIFDHNLLLNSGGPFFTSLCVDVSHKYGNISADPQFVNQAAGDFHLQPTSPAIDAGNTSVLQSLADDGLTLSNDFDGKPRLQDTKGNGYPVIDIGAYEYSGLQDANPTTIVLTPSAYQVDGGTSLGLTAKLVSPDGTPTGTVTFIEDGKRIGGNTIDATGTATDSTPPLVPGTHSFIAKYAGQGSFTPATSVVVIVLVNKYSVALTLTSSPNPSRLGQTVTFKLNISAADGLPPGAIVLTDQSTNTTLATLTPDANGNSTYATSTLTLGDHVINASYAGDSLHYSANAQLTQTVVDGAATTTSLASSLNPSTSGQSVTFTATVTANAGSGTPVGAVTFLDGAKSLATVTLQNGVAAYSTSSLSVGTHSIAANYSNSTNWKGSSASLSQVVNGIQTSTVLTAVPNPVYATHSVKLTAQVAGMSGGTPTGSVTFFDGGAQLATASLNSSGNAAATITFAAASSTPHLLTAVYGGDTTFGGSNSQVVQETVLINPTTTVIASITPNPVAAFHSVTLVADIASSTSPVAKATGVVTFTAKNATLGTAAVQNDSAKLTVNAGAAGTYPVLATYGGDPAFGSSVSASGTYTVIPESSSVTLTSSANPAIVNTQVTFKAVVTPEAAGDPVTGTMTFFDGARQLGSPVSVKTGAASFATSTLSVGTHSITAVYSGDSNVLSATSAALEQSIVLYTGDFELKATPSDAAVYTGEFASFTIAVSPKNGFNYPVDLSCGNLPAGTACTFAPASISGGHGQATLLVQTSAPQKTTAGLKASGTTAVLAAVFGMFFLPRRRRFIWLATILMAVLGFSGCGNNPQIAGGTPPGVYKVTVTAHTPASGPQLQHSVDLNLTVKSLF